MKKITKIVASVLCLTCMSVALTGCEAKEEADKWFDKVFGWLTPDETPDDSTSTDDKDEENKDNTNTGTNEENKGNENSGGNSSGAEDNENEGSGNTGTDDKEEEKPVTPPADTIEVSGEMIKDMVNKIVVRPSKATVGVGETFVIEVESLEYELSDTPVFSIADEYATYASVDKNGNVTALKVGEAIVSVAVGENKYNVETTIVTEAQGSDTYALNCVYIYEDFTVVVIPHEVKMHVGDVFTVTAEDSTMENVTLTAEEIAAAGYVSITGTTITAVKEGYTEVVLDWDGIYVYMVKITIIE